MTSDGRARAREAAGLSALFVLVVAAPLVLTFLGLDPSPRLDEKRELAPPPYLSPTIEGLYAFPSEAEAFFDDHFGLRASFVRLHNLLVSRVPGSLVSERVLVGREGWLYYYPAVTASRSQPPFSAAELEALVASVEARGRWLAARGVRYLLVLVPNKAEVYPEHLPRAWRERPPQTRLDQLVAVLAHSPVVELVDLREPLTRLKGVGQVYFRTDSHWTGLGLGEALRRTLEAIHHLFPEAAPTPLDGLGHGPGEPYVGDLARMIGLGPLYVERQRPLRWLAMPPASGPVRALFIHDSFGDPLLPLLEPVVDDIDPASSFAEAAARIAHGERRNVVIDEVVERFIVPRLGPRRR